MDTQKESIVEVAISDLMNLSQVLSREIIEWESAVEALKLNGDADAAEVAIDVVFSLYASQQALEKRVMKLKLKN